MRSNANFAAGYKLHDLEGRKRERERGKETAYTGNSEPTRRERTMTTASRFLTRPRANSGSARPRRHARRGGQRRMKSQASIARQDEDACTLLSMARLLRRAQNKHSHAHASHTSCARCFFTHTSAAVIGGDGSPSQHRRRARREVRISVYLAHMAQGAEALRQSGDVSRATQTWGHDHLMHQA